MSELRKPFFLKIRTKNEKTENQYKMPHVNKKPLARNENLIQTKTYAQNEL